jgi:hypothetical protein
MFSFILKKIKDFLDLVTAATEEQSTIEKQDVVEEQHGTEKQKDILHELCQQNNLNYRFVTAVTKVESSGCAFRNYPGLGENFPTLRFEPHKFNKYTIGQKMPFTNNGRGFSSKKEETNYKAFIKARKLDEDSAIRATSFGQFQIMGFHYKNLRYSTPNDFLNDMMTINGQHTVFIKFIMRNKILRTTLQKQQPIYDDFYAFAKSYNGSSNADNYAKKIQLNY